MPKLTGAGISKQTSVFNLQDLAGNRARVTVNSTTATTAQVTAFADALGNASNAALTSYAGSMETLDDVATRQAFDDGHSDVSTKLVLVFQNAERKVRKFEVPAPDASLFGSDGITADLSNGLVTDLRDKFKAIADSDGGPWVLVRGALVAKSRKSPRSHIVPRIAEPTTGQLPPPAPGA